MFNLFYIHLYQLHFYIYIFFKIHILIKKIYIFLKIYNKYIERLNIYKNVTLVNYIIDKKIYIKVT